MKNTYFNWSSGKDSALALHRLLQGKEYHITKLVTTVNTDFDRVAMHGLRTGLLEQQADAIAIPLTKINLAGNVSMFAYDHVMQKNMKKLAKANYTHCVFGDIFLEDLKAYRDEQLTKAGIKGVYPLWKADTKALLKEFIDLGFKAITVCVNAKLLDASFCGRLIDDTFIDDLPDSVDRCGENGEFHTFVYDGPIFKKPVSFDIGKKVLRNYSSTSYKDDDCFLGDTTWDTSFWYCDLLPKT